LFQSLFSTISLALIFLQLLFYCLLFLPWKFIQIAARWIPNSVRMLVSFLTKIGFPEIKPIVFYVRATFAVAGAAFFFLQLDNFRRVRSGLEISMTIRSTVKEIIAI